MWATSIGSTFSHRPVPGERKSGMPEGTEIPAPVRATTEPASRTRSARRSTAVSVRATAASACRGRRRCPPCASSEANTRAKPAFSASMPLVEVARGADLLDLPRPPAAPARPARGPSAARRRTARGRSTMRLTRPNSNASSARIASPVRFISRALFSPTRRGRRWVPPKPGMIPSLISGWPKIAERGDQAHVAGHGQLAAAAVGEAVDRGDRRDAARARARAAARARR